MKKSLLFLVCLVLAIICPGIAAAETAPAALQSGDYTYILQADGTAEITGYTGSDTDVVVPDTLDGHAVSVIGKEVFFSCADLTTISIPYSVSSIGDFSFYACPELTTVFVPHSVVEIGASVFENCPKLTTVYVVPGSFADQYVKEKHLPRLPLYDYKVNENAAEITSYNGAETKLSVPDVLDGYPVAAIGAEAFFNCEGLTSVAIPNSVVSISGNAFAYCSALTDITVSPDHPVFEMIDGVIFDKTTNQLVLYPCSLPNSQYTIPAFVTSIGDHAFSTCSSLAGVHIPASVTSVGKNPFLYSSSSFEITVDTDHPTLRIENGALISNENNELISCPRSYARASYVIPDSVASIGDFAFAGCQSLLNVTIPDSVVAIGDYAFFNSDLTSLSLPDSVVSIGDSAFYRCNSLLKASLGNSVASIGDYAFLSCLYLTSVSVPASVTDIGEYAFYMCSELTLKVEEDSYAEQYAIENELPYTVPVVVNLPVSTAFEYTVLEDGTAEIDKYTGDAGEVGIPDTLDGYVVTSIGNEAFGSCKHLTAVSIPNTVTSIGNYAFFKCVNLTGVYLSDSVVRIGNNAFESCESLTSIEIPSSVTAIGNKAFRSCKQLISVSLPNSVETIGEKAFEECARLTEITIPDSVTSIGEKAFAKCERMINLTIPASVTSIGKSAFDNCFHLTLTVVRGSYADQYFQKNYWPRINYID